MRYRFRKVNRKERLACTLLLVVMSLKVYPSKLFELSLEELLKVNVVSGRDEGVSRSPGVVSVYYPEKLRLMGLQTLPEMLAFAAGVEINDSIGANHTLQIRGLTDPNNQKVLFLLNGIPYWSASHGLIPIDGMPLIAIERIEIIRGPASVIYGTNSSAGVINLVTKTSNNTLSTLYSTNNLAQTGVFYSHKLEAGRFEVALEVDDDNGFDTQAVNTFGSYSLDCSCFPLISESSIERINNKHSFLTRFAHDSLLLTYHSFRSERQAYSNGNIFSPTNFIEQGKLLAVDYRHSLSIGELRYFSEWNQYSFKREITDVLGFINVSGDGRIDFANNGDGTYRWRNGVHLDWDLSDHWRILSGLEFERRQTDNHKFHDARNGQDLFLLTQPPFNFPYVIEADGSILLIDENRVNENTLWMQAEGSFENHRFITGFRYTDNAFSGSRVTPRVSWVYHWNRHQTFKVLYGEGFNSPTFRQISGRNTFGISLDSNVSAELIQNLDVSYSFTDYSFNHVLSFFITNAKKLIQVSATEVTNSDSAVRRSGAEYEFLYQSDQWRWKGSVSFLQQGNRDTEDDPAALFASRWMVNLGATRRFNQHSLGTVVQYVSSRAEVPDGHFLNVSYRWQQDAWRVHLDLINVTDEKRWQPDVRGLGALEINSLSERYWQFELSYLF